MNAIETPHRFEPDSVNAGGCGPEACKHCWQRSDAVVHHLIGALDRIADALRVSERSRGPVSIQDICDEVLRQLPIAVARNSYNVRPVVDRVLRDAAAPPRCGVVVQHPLGHRVICLEPRGHESGCVFVPLKEETSGAMPG